MNRVLTIDDIVIDKVEIQKKTKFLGVIVNSSLTGRFGRQQPKHGTLYQTMSGWLINSKLSDPV